MLKFDLASKAAAHADHWINAEAALGRGIVLPDGTTRTVFTALGQTVGAAQTRLIQRTNDLEGAQRSRDNALVPLQAKATLFTALVRGATPGSAFANMVPTLPTTTAAAIKWAKTLEDIGSIWERLDSAPAAQFPALAHPVTLADGTVREAFVAELAGFQAALRLVQDATNDIKEARGTLAQEGQRVRESLSAYRKLLRGLFPKSAPIIGSLPAR